MVTPAGKRFCVTGQNKIAEISALINTAPINTAAGFPRATFTNSNSANRAQNGNSAKHERINNGRWISAKRQQPRQDSADQTDGVGFKNIRSHTGAIAYVVTDIISDHRRISWIVFFETTLDLAHEIGAYVGGFGVNAATQSREDADETAAQSESNQTAYRSVAPDQFCSDRVKDGHGEQRKPDYEQTGHGAAVESHAQRIESSDTGGLRCANICQNGYAHADEARHERAESADYESNCRRVIFEKEKQNENDHCDDADSLDLPIQIGFGAFLHGGRDLSHPFSSRWRPYHHRDQTERERKSNHGAHHRQWHA